MNPLSRPHWLGVALIMATGLLLAGCAMTRMIDSEVQSYLGAAGAQTGAAYRFERLPSQQGGHASQEALEAMTERVLGQHGLTRNDSQARYSVQISVDAVQYQREPRYPRVFGGVFVAPDGTLRHRAPMMVMTMEPPWYRHTVHLLMRDVPTAQLAYETHATHEGPWSDTGNLLPAILEAALRNYPQASPQMHTVVVELPPPADTEGR
jgi:hypothetical protein